jgi:hypothetical protein
MAEEDKELDELLKKLIKLWSDLRPRGAPADAKEVVINPLPGDPEAVPPGLTQFRGYVANAVNAPANLKYSLYKVKDTGLVDVANPLFDAVPPAVLGAKWSIFIALLPQTDYCLYVYLQEGSAPYPSQKLFFSTTNVNVVPE